VEFGEPRIDSGTDRAHGKNSLRVDDIQAAELKAAQLPGSAYITGPPLSETWV
jgi:hypothetical protein